MVTGKAGRAWGIGLAGVLLALAGCGGTSDGGNEVNAREKAGPWPTLSGEEPIVIAHRGASGYRPEHTLEAYSLAIDMGADYIEPDLVVTADGHLIARHDIYLSSSTDVASHPEFADRRRDLNGQTDWFVQDFTLAEIKTLRARQAFLGRTRDYDGEFSIPTLAEILDLIAAKEAETGRRIGIYPETKQPGLFASLGLDFAEPLLTQLGAAGYKDADDPVFIQSFEPEILRKLSELTDIRLVMLLFSKKELDPEAGEDDPNLPFEAFADFVDGVGPYKGLLTGPTGQTTDFVAAAHRRGLVVHPYTLRTDRVGDGFDSVEAEIKAYLDAGVDGFFTDFPDTGISVVAEKAAELGEAE